MGKGTRYLPLLVCGIGFVLGALLGLFPVMGMACGGERALGGLLAGYRAAMGAGAGVPGYLILFWSCAKWPAFLCLLGFTALGVWLIPAAFALRGFFLSVSVAALVRVGAGRGAVLALLLFGMEGLFALPVLFWIGARCWVAARGLAGRVFWRPGQPLPLGADYWLQCILCIVILALGALAERAALPPLLRGAMALLTGA